MKFVLNGIKTNIYDFMRGLGYHFSGQDEKAGELEFTHPIRSDEFPRFHIFLKPEGDDLFFNLHLDQRAPVYKGVSAHEGEYEGPLVENEAGRIKQNF